MKPISTDAPIAVYTRKSFSQMLSHLSQQPMIALDTESDSFFVYTPKVCLIQISAFADPLQPDPLAVVDYIVDPLRLPSLHGLDALLAHPQIEVVMHAADNDMLTLQRDFNFQFRRIFDTQLAARILGWQQVGLASLLESCFGVVSDKRMQRTNWGIRPLTPQQISYAQMDTHYLFALRALLIEKLQAAQRWEEALDAFGSLAQTDQAARTPPPRSVWNMKASRTIEPQYSGLLEALWEWRELEAQRLNRPPFKVMGDEMLVLLATEQPDRIDDLNDRCHLSERQLSRYGATLLQVIADACRRPPPTPPPPTIRPEHLLSKSERMRFERLRQWRTLTAEARGVSPEIVFNNEILIEIAQRGPKNVNELSLVPGVSSWKADTYGHDVLNQLHAATS